MQEPLLLVKQLLTTNRIYNSLQALQAQANTNSLRDFSLADKLLLY